MKLSKLSTVLLAGSLMTMGMAAKADEASSGPITVSGDVSFTSDYFYRGYTQSDSAAIQGTISLSHESGAYFTLWGSSIAFASGLELDPSIGYAGKAGDVDYDVGVLYYGYPNSTSLNGGVKEDFVEVYGSVSMAGATFGVAYAPEFYNKTGKSIYLNASYGTEVAGFGLSAYLGYNILDDKFYADDVLDYKLAVSKEVSGLGLELAYVGNDDDTVDEGVVFTVSKSF